MKKERNDVTGNPVGSRVPDSEKIHPAEQVNLLEELASFCQTSGEYSTALEYYAQILDLAQRAAQSPDLLFETARKMANCLEGTGEFEKALEMLNLAIDKGQDESTSSEYASALVQRSHILGRIGNYAEAETDVHKALAILQKQPMSRQLADGFSALGSIALRTSRMELARESYESSLAISRALGDREEMGSRYNNLGIVCKNVGHLEEAAQFHAKALGIARDLGRDLQVAIRLNNIGVVEYKRGRWPEARTAWEESLAIFQKRGNKWEVAIAYLNVAHAHRAARDFQKAEELYTLSLQTSRENGDKRTEVLYYEHFGELCLRRGEYGRAERILTQGLELAEGISPGSELSCEILRRRAECRIERNEWKEAEADLDQGLALAVNLGDRYEEGALLRVQSDLLRLRGQVHEARDLLRRSHERLTEIGAQYESAVSAVQLSRILAEEERERPEARRLVSGASKLFQHLGASQDFARAQLVLAKILLFEGDSYGVSRLLSEIESTIEESGSRNDRDTLRDIRVQADRSLVSSSVTESNTLAAFNQIVRRIHAIADPEERLQATLDIIHTQTGAERLLLLLTEEEGGKPPVRESRAIPPREWHTTVEVARMAIRSCFDGGGDPILSTNPMRDSRIDHSLPQLDRVGSFLALPIVGEKLEGCGIYLEKSLDSRPFGREELDLALALAAVTAGVVTDLQAEEIRSENLRLKHRLGMGEGFQGIVTQSPRMLKIIDTLQKIEGAESTVLLQGETGTGKELFARAIHQSSLRKDKPFVTVNCAELSQDVLESELFGHSRGAFTDAKNAKQGLFERASGGTVFIDEIDKTNRNFQDTLLRVVDQREVKPVGATDPIPVDVRIICAANKELRIEVDNDRFLQDLYYRLRVVSIVLPPLRERKEDVTLLADHFLRIHSRKMQKSFDGFQAETLRLMVDYHWPGNVRDLAHEVERIVAVTPEGTYLTPDTLSPEITQAADLDASGTLGEVVERIEQQMIRDALKKCNGNKSRTARALGLSRRGLLNKLQRYHIR